jgi:hypothetical protein
MPTCAAWRAFGACVASVRSVATGAFSGRTGFGSRGRNRGGSKAPPGWYILLWFPC